ncbi:MAG: tetratricopeptide repeat protein [Spirochaetales bacterium]|nr:tetratricopeptide repeat protein [Spirochaetales bacterium]
MLSADQLNSEGIRLSRSGKYDKALLAFTTALELEPANPRIIYNMALVFIRKEDYPTARELLEKAIELEGETADFHNDLGLCLYRTGQKEEALAEYDRALEIDPTHSTAWNNRGVYFFQKDDFTQAEECFRTSVNLNPDWEDSWFNLRDTYEMLGERNKWKEAHKMYRKLSRVARKS